MNQAEREVRKHFMLAQQMGTIWEEPPADKSALGILATVAFAAFGFFLPLFDGVNLLACIICGGICGAIAWAGTN